MAEILLEGRDCEACGTPVRKGALFCYHCGMSVAPDLAVTTDTEIIDESHTIEDKSEIAEEDAEIIEDEIVEDRVIEDDAEVDKDESVISEDKAENAEEEAIAEKAEKPKLETAAAMRRKPKRIQKKRVEIVWEEPNSPPNVWFLIATILFAILAVGLWIVANYLG